MLVYFNLMPVHFNGDRAIFTPYTAENDIDPETKRAGVKSYNCIVGFFLSLFGYATQITTDDQTTFYVNTKSALRWLNRHGIQNMEDPFEDPVLCGPIGRKGRNISNGINIAIRIATLTQILQKNPKNQNALSARAMTYLNHGTPQQIIADMTALLELNLPENKRHQYIRFRADACETEGSEESLQQAILDFTEMDRIDSKMPNPNDSFDNRPPLQRRADIYVKMGKLDLALQDYTKAMELVPDAKSLRMDRAKLYYEMKMYQEAKADLDAELVERGQRNFGRLYISQELQDFICKVEKALQSENISG